MAAAFEGLLDLLFPKAPVPGRRPRVERPFCERCGEPFGGDFGTDFTCTNCLGRTWYVKQARAAYRAEGAVLETIHAFKYRGAFHHLPELGDWLLEGYDQFYASDRWDWVVPVPLHPRRERERTFNQAHELARWLSARRRLKLVPCLNRVKETETQARLRRSQRLRNQAGAFEFRDRPPVPPGATCLIIDDVFTTGATVNACARALKKAGVAEVCALTVARG